MNAVNQVQEASAVYAVEQHALLKSFDLLATAPEGVTRLRELILSLAVQGKLVPQDPNDEPASVLLERIRAEKQGLIKAGKLKKDKPLAEIAEEEKPFELPQGWEWVSGRDLFSVIRGVSYQKDQATDQPSFGHTPILRANNIRETVNFDELVFVPNELVSEEQKLVLGDYVVCMASGSKNLVGKAATFEHQGLYSFGAFCAAVRPLLVLPILKAFFASQLYRAEVSRESAGIGINNLKSSTLLALQIPVPPLAEQSRIVARVEELMELCDALEQQGRLEAAQHARLVGTLFDTLANSESAHALAENWQRVAASFDLLLDRPEAVDALEQTLLQLAVRGLLVPQDPKDEPASELLKKIRQEKDHLIATGKIKRDKPLPDISEDEKPFELPQGWEWARVGNVFNTTSGNTFDASLERESGQYMYIKVGDMNLPGNALVITTATRFINPDKKAELALIPVGSIIFPKRGGAIATNKKRIIETPVFVDLNTMAITPVLLSTSYAYLWLLTVDLAELNSGTSVPQINHKDIDPLLFPLAPLAEQSRIVARVAELRKFCADLRARLTAARTTQTRLAEALVEQAA